MAQERADLLEPEAPVLAPGTRFARYDIVRCIGVGGMGAVFEATHSMLRKRVALKTLHSNLGRSEAARQRFLREAETVARVRHPNVVDISDVGIENGVPYLVMEFLEGEDLARVLESGPLGPEQAVDTALPVAAGLVAVHKLGIVHRDIKPENILLARDVHGDIVPKLVDFGVSKDLEASLRAGAPPLHTVTGTPHYMSPEQARGSAALDARTDQYALGILLYQCLSGQRPYDSESLLELIHLIDTGVHRPLRSLVPAVPEALEQVVHRAMSRHPRDRFASTEAFGRALLPFASERTRLTYARDFEGESTLRAGSLTALDSALSERLAAATMPAEVLAGGLSAQGDTSSGIRVRGVPEEPEQRAGSVDLPNRGQRRAFAWGALLVLFLACGVIAWIQLRSATQAPARTSVRAPSTPEPSVQAPPPSAPPKPPADALGSAPQQLAPTADHAAPTAPAVVEPTAPVEPVRQHRSGARKRRTSAKPTQPAVKQASEPLDIQLSR
jgi:serine/threonine-protein kinase